jgi:hypothetical protein
MSTVGTPNWGPTGVVFEEWEDLNFNPTDGGGPTPTLPADVTINNVFYKEFSSSNNQKCGSQQEIPHSYKLGTIIYPHAHIFLKAAESAGTTGVTFTLYWEIRQSTGTTNGNLEMTATSAQLAANGNKVNIYNAPAITGPTELGAQVAVTLARTGGDAGDVIVLTYGLHYASDSVGSRQPTSK